MSLTVFVHPAISFMWVYVCMWQESLELILAVHTLKLILTTVIPPFQEHQSVPERLLDLLWEKGQRWEVPLRERARRQLPNCVGRVVGCKSWI